MKARTRPALALAILSAACLLYLSSCSGEDGTNPKEDVASQPDQSGEAADQGIEARGADEPFGRVCTNLGEACEGDDPFGLICLGIQGGSQDKGLCTRTCSDLGNECFGAPNGQHARCIAGGSGNYCIFLCKDKELSWLCPGTLRCGEITQQQSAICLP